MLYIIGQEKRYGMFSKLSFRKFYETLDWEDIIKTQMEKIAAIDSLVDESEVQKITEILTKPENNAEGALRLMVMFANKLTPHNPGFLSYKKAYYREPIIGNLLNPNKVESAKLAEMKEKIQKNAPKLEKKDINWNESLAFCGITTDAEYFDAVFSHSEDTGRALMKIILFPHVYDDGDRLWVKSIIFHEATHANDFYLLGGFPKPDYRESERIRSMEKYLTNYYKSFYECRAITQQIQFLIMSYIQESNLSPQETKEKILEFLKNLKSIDPEKTFHGVRLLSPDESIHLITALVTEIIDKNEYLIKKEAFFDNPTINKPEIQAVRKSKSLESVMGEVVMLYNKIFEKIISPKNLFKNSM